MNTDNFANIVFLEENGILLSLFALYGFFLMKQVQMAKRYGLRKTAALLYSTTAWLFLLYLLDLVEYLPFTRVYSTTHMCFFVSIDLLVEPLCLVTLSLLTKRRPYDKGWVIGHFAPFVFCILVSVFVENFWFAVVMLVAAVIYGLICLFLIWKASVRYTRAVENEYSSLEGRSIRWLYVLPVLLSIQMIIYMMYLWIDSMWMIDAYYVVSIVMWWFYFTRSFRLLIERAELPDNPDEIEEKLVEEEDLMVEEQPLEEGEIAFEEQLKKVCEDANLYLRENLNRDDLAQAMGTNHTYLTRQLQDKMGCNFYTYVNGLRIARAKRLMLEHPEWPLEQIAIECGYRNKTTFYNAFQRITEQTPTEWKRRA